MHPGDVWGDPGIALQFLNGAGGEGGITPPGLIYVLNMELFVHFAALQNERRQQDPALAELTFALTTIQKQSGVASQYCLHSDSVY